MTTTIPRLNPLNFKVPGILMIGLLAAQFLFLGGEGGPEPECILNVEHPHLSTSLKETLGINVIKLNITSICNVPQIHTRIASKILKAENSQESVAHVFPIRIVASTSKLPQTAFFKNIFIQCFPGVKASYRGFATGTVKLKNGKEVSVSGSSEKFVAVNCTIGAQ